MARRAAKFPRKAKNLTPPESTRNTKAAKLHPEPGADSASTSTPLLWLTVLSLDAPAVAVLWQLLFARSFHAQISAGITVLLALVVWLIYVADRLLDTLKVPAQGAEPTRHLFYRRYLWAFLLPFTAVFLLAAWMSLTRLDETTFRYGAVILLAVGVYFLAVHLLSPGREWLPKEMLVGVLFALGTCFPVLEKTTPGDLAWLAPYLVFTMLCWINCAVIEYEEWKRLRHRQSGTPHPWTIWMGRRFLWMTFAVALLLACLIASGFGRSHRELLTAELLSALAFALIRYKDKALSIDQFRVLVDLALFTPIFFLIFR